MKKKKISRKKGLLSNSKAPFSLLALRYEPAPCCSITYQPWWSPQAKILPSTLIHSVSLYQKNAIFALIINVKYFIDFSLVKTTPMHYAIHQAYCIAMLPWTCSHSKIIIHSSRQSFLYKKRPQIIPHSFSTLWILRQWIVWVSEWDYLSSKSTDYQKVSMWIWIYQWVDNLEFLPITGDFVQNLLDFKN